MKYKKSWQWLLIVLAVLGLSACKTSSTASDSLSSISLSADETKVPSGTILQYTATGVGGGNPALTDSATWSITSGNAKIITVTGDADFPIGTVITYGPGNVVINATYAGVSGSTTLEVNDEDLIAVDVTPHTPSYATAVTNDIQFKATGIYRDGKTVDLTDYATWTSGTAATALVSNAYNSKGLVSAVAAGTTAITATYTGTANTKGITEFNDASTLTLTSATVSSVSITPKLPDAATSTITPLTATAILSDNSVQDVTASALWGSTAGTGTATASNSQKGKSTAITAGTVVLDITSSTATDSTTMTVLTSHALSSIQVQPAVAVMGVGAKMQLTAEGVYSNGTVFSNQDLTNEATWVSSDSTVAIVCNSAACKGKITAIKAGSVTITVGGPNVAITKSIAVTVLDSSYSLTQIEVTPTDQPIVSGSVDRVRAKGIYSDGTNYYMSDITDSVFWAVTDTTLAEVSNAADDKGRLSLYSTGDVSITAKLDGVYGKTTLNALPSTWALSSVHVWPQDPVNAPVVNRQLHAYGLYLKDSVYKVVDITKAVNWTPNTTALSAVVNVSNAEGSKGLATSGSTAGGPATITATLGTVTGTTGFTTRVAATYAFNAIGITPGNPSVPLGADIQLHANGIMYKSTTSYLEEDLTERVTWVATDPTVFQVDNRLGNRGWGKALKAGSTIVTAYWEDSAAVAQSAATTVTVHAYSLSSILLTPEYGTLSAGENLQLFATGSYSNGGSISSFDLTPSVIWQSQYTGLTKTGLPISSLGADAGRAAYREAGTIPLKAFLGAVTGSTSLTTDSLTLSSISISPAVASIVDATSKQYKAYGTYSDDSVRDITENVVWHSGTVATAEISNSPTETGKAYGLAAGTTAISATLGSIVSNSSTLTVRAPATMTSIEITPTAGTYGTGVKQQFKAMGIFSDNTSQDITEEVTWRTGTVATGLISNQVGSHGLLSPLAAGTTTVEADWDLYAVAAATTTITLEARTLGSLTLSPQNPTIFQKYSIQLTAIGLYTNTSSNNSSQEVTEEVVWTSSDSTIATVSNKPGEKGLVWGKTSGQVTITAKLGAKEISTTVVVW